VRAVYKRADAAKYKDDSHSQQHQMPLGQFLCASSRIVSGSTARPFLDDISSFPTVNTRADIPL
jgi:hypothetical protein